MIRKTCALLAAGFLLVSGLSACGEEQPPAAAGGTGNSGAQGDVQGGAVEDAMLPLDTVTSQSPPRGGGGDGSDEDDGADGADGAAESGDEGADED